MSNSTDSYPFGENPWEVRLDWSRAIYPQVYRLVWMQQVSRILEGSSPTRVLLHPRVIDALLTEKEIDDLAPPYVLGGLWVTSCLDCEVYVPLDGISADALD